MKSAVVDASVAAKWVVEEADTDKAVLLLSYDALHAPDHWLAEASNVLWAKVVRSEMDAADAEERMAILLRAPVTGSPISRLLPRAFAISLARQITIYDSLYVTLAETLDVAMVTADIRLVRRVAPDTALASRMVLLRDLG